MTEPQRRSRQSSPERAARWAAGSNRGSDLNRRPLGYECICAHKINRTQRTKPKSDQQFLISPLGPSRTTSVHLPHTERHPEPLTVGNVLVQVPPSPILPVKPSRLLRALTGEGMDFVISPPIWQKQSVHASVSIGRCADEGGQGS